MNQFTILLSTVMIPFFLLPISTDAQNSMQMEKMTYQGNSNANEMYQGNSNANEMYQGNSNANEMYQGNSNANEMYQGNSNANEMYQGNSNANEMYQGNSNANEIYQGNSNADEMYRGNSNANEMYRGNSNANKMYQGNSNANEISLEEEQVLADNQNEYRRGRRRKRGSLDTIVGFVSPRYWLWMRTIPDSLTTVDNSYGFRTTIWPLKHKPPPTKIVPLWCVLEVMFWPLVCIYCLLAFCLAFCFGRYFRKANCLCESLGYVRTCLLMNFCCCCAKRVACKFCEEHVVKDDVNEKSICLQELKEKCNAQSLYDEQRNMSMTSISPGRPNSGPRRLNSPWTQNGPNRPNSPWTQNGPNRPKTPRTQNGPNRPNSPRTQNGPRRPNSPWTQNGPRRPNNASYSDQSSNSVHNYQNFPHYDNQSRQSIQNVDFPNTHCSRYANRGHLDDDTTISSLSTYDNDLPMYSRPLNFRQPQSSTSRICDRLDKGPSVSFDLSNLASRN
ncbi:hypothetical protein M8J75_000470 [Diaphorina citri]|nr:hypothetical protein M8J75_000470 [Diaphorina citri]